MWPSGNEWTAEIRKDKIKTKSNTNILQKYCVQNKERIVGVGELCALFICYASNEIILVINILETCSCTEFKGHLKYIHNYKNPCTHD